MGSKPGANARRSVSLDALLPVLYLKGEEDQKTIRGTVFPTQGRAFGHSFGPVAVMPSLQEALSALLGTDAPNRSPGVLARLTAGWQADHDTWTQRDLSARHSVYIWVYIWADGVYLQARMEEKAECMLVIIGATSAGKKELVGFQVGLRQRARIWHELLTDIKGRRLAIAPEIAVGEGAMGFWNALDKAFASPKHQRSGCLR